MSSEIWDRQMREYIDRYATELGNRPQSQIEFEGVSVKHISKRVITRAAEKALDAGYSGAHHDGGARRLVSELKAWCRGLDGELPEEFREDCVTITKEEDPEYAEYLRLREKFK